MEHMEDDDVEEGKHTRTDTSCLVTIRVRTQEMCCGSIGPQHQVCVASLIVLVLNEIRDGPPTVPAVGGWLSA